MGRIGVRLPSSGPERRLVQTVMAVVFVQSLGGSAIVPLLPTYLTAHGSTPGLVGVVMGSFFLASVVTQYPIGKLTDRVGARVVIGAGLVVFAIGCVGFASSAGAAGSISYRALQGVGAGAVALAGAAAIGARVPRGERGTAFAAMNAARMLGFAVGPLVGSAIGASSMRLLFVLAAIVSMGGLPMLATFPDHVAASRARLDEEHRTTTASGRIRPTAVLLGAALVFGASGLVNGLYESCWSLLLHSRHAPSIAIGLSWTLYCFPFALLSGLSGRLADRSDRRLLAVVGTSATALFALAYPFIGSVGLLVGLGCLEAVGAVVVAPAALSVLSEAVPARSQGAAQAVVQTAWTAATALAAIACGALFGVNRSLPFAAVGASLLGLAGLVGWAWRRVPGHVTDRDEASANAATLDDLGDLVTQPTQLL